MPHGHSKEKSSIHVVDKYPVRDLNSILRIKSPLHHLNAYEAMNYPIFELEIPTAFCSRSINFLARSLDNKAALTSPLSTSM